MSGLEAYQLLQSLIPNPLDINKLVKIDSRIDNVYAQLKLNTWYLWVGDTGYSVGNSLDYNHTYLILMTHYHLGEYGIKLFNLTGIGNSTLITHTYDVTYWKSPVNLKPVEEDNFGTSMRDNLFKLELLNSAPSMMNWKTNPFI